MQKRSVSGIESYKVPNWEWALSQPRLNTSWGGLRRKLAYVGHGQASKKMWPTNSLPTFEAKRLIIFSLTSRKPSLLVERLSLYCSLCGAAKEDIKEWSFLCFFLIYSTVFPFAADHLFLLAEVVKRLAFAFLKDWGNVGPICNGNTFLLLVHPLI